MDVRWFDLVFLASVLAPKAPIRQFLREKPLLRIQIVRHQRPELLVEDVEDVGFLIFVRIFLICDDLILSTGYKHNFNYRY